MSIAAFVISLVRQATGLDDYTRKEWVRLVRMTPPSGFPLCHFFQRSKIILGQRHEEVFAVWPTPSIAFDAADQSFAVMIDFNKSALALTTIAEVVHGVCLSTRVGLARAYPSAFD